MNAVRSILGGPKKVAFCGAIQYANLVGVAIGYSISRARCFHKPGHDVPCKSSRNPYMILFNVTPILLSRIPDLDQIWWFSILAAGVSSFTYSSISLSLGIAQTLCKLLIRSSTRFVITIDGLLIADMSSTDAIACSRQWLVQGHPRRHQPHRHRLGLLLRQHPHQDPSKQQQSTLLLSETGRISLVSILTKAAAAAVLVLVQLMIKAPPPAESKVMQKVMWLKKSGMRIGRSREAAARAGRSLPSSARAGDCSVLLTKPYSFITIFIFI
jgi:hypothetical protein